MCKSPKSLSWFLTAVLVTACTSAGSGPSPRVTPLPQTRADVVGAAATQFVRDKRATREAKATAAFKATESQATQASEGTATQMTASATAQARSMYERVQNLFTSGALSTLEGNYVLLPNFDASWAQIDYYDFLLTERTPADFALRADMAWESASATANLWNSGCGFVFRVNARGDHYLALLSSDGWYSLYLNLDGTLTRLGRSRYSEESAPQRNVDVMVVVERDSITVFVDHVQIHRQQDPTLSAGLLGYALASGTNKGFGTRCRMTNVELWELDG